MKILSIVLCMSVLSGCATLFNGRKQSVSVDTVPSGANVKIDSVNKCLTPCILDLSRNRDYTIYIEKEGYPTKTQSLLSSTSGVVWVNIIWGIAGVIPLAFDFSTGGAYKLTPKQLNVELNQNQGAKK